MHEKLGLLMDEEVNGTKANISGNPHMLSLAYEKIL